MCPDCKAHNYASRAECFVCKSSRCSHMCTDRPWHHCCCGACETMFLEVKEAAVMAGHRGWNIESLFTGEGGRWSAPQAAPCRAPVQIGEHPRSSVIQGTCCACRPASAGPPRTSTGRLPSSEGWTERAAPGGSGGYGRRDEAPPRVPADLDW